MFLPILRCHHLITRLMCASLNSTYSSLGVSRAGGVAAGVAAREGVAARGGRLAARGRLAMRGGLAIGSR